ncbi:peptide ABC transporter ATP-binding protein [Candidatus Desulfofervidus auxilii]|uniref:Peptide ABC transporter ATP-binding protein n=1 Tax=Desulfofervidus auxilii TaxID=1621989 RepID=A0A7U4TIB9_DESA2|nr:ABC transporter ATP-binding protein [Candidatus Desulfofervidus auxilii]AMM41140.1 peptide ABC transporter ATP-binding protein [Candidatus Desulfofervidus auxilii]
MLLKVHNLHVWFRKKKQTIPAVNGVSFSIAQDDTLGLVGESGSGKTITALAILGLVPPPGEIIKGEILFLGQNLLFLPPKRWQQLRGKEISIIFQDPMTSLNPVFTIGEQIAEVFTHHFEYSAKEAKIKAIELLKKVGIPAAESRLNTYPHQLSGGLRQRVMIAIALAAQPKLLIADEPTTALDVTVQAQILELMLNLKRQMGMSILFISHDLTVVAQVVRRIAVMYAGKIIEMANTEELFKNPLHPYTQGLLNAIPRIEDISDKKRHLRTIAGQNGQAFTTLGCSFARRCDKRLPICLRRMPDFREYSEKHQVACWLYE